MEDNIKFLREKGAPVQEIIRIKRDYLDSMEQNLKSMIDSGVFRSNTVTQMLLITRRMNYPSVCRDHPQSIHAVIRDKSSKVPMVRRYDPFFRAWDTFTKVLEDANKFFHLNAGNLCGMVELLIAQLFFKFAHTNKTWTFFYCTVIFESGNGHFSAHTPDGPLPNRLKINNVGSDFTKDRVSDIWGTMYDILHIPKKDRCYDPLNTMRSTPTVFENLACMAVKGQEILSTPQPETNFQVIAMPENRDDQGALIHFGLARGPEGLNVTSFGRAEDPKTRNGEVLLKRKISPVCITQISTNRPPKGAEDAEKGKTIDAVAAVMQNGTNPPAPKKVKGAFGDSGSESVMPRTQELSDEMKHVVANCLAFTQNFAGLQALLNNTGALSIEVSMGSLGGYAWLCYYIKQYAGGMFDAYMIEGFSRAMEGYKSRCVVYCMWIKTMSIMSKGGDMQDAIRRLWGDIPYNALPLCAIVPAVCNILYRCLNMACFTMLTVLAADLDVPYISWKSLKKFFAATHAPLDDDEDVTYVEEFALIKEFIVRCLDGNRFCPNDDSPFGLHENVSCYITNDGVDNTMLPLSKNLLMRISPSRDKEDSDDITTKVAQRIESKEGRSLVTICQMGPGFRVYKYALDKLLNEFLPEFRGLLPGEMFHSETHFKKLGIHSRATGMSNYNDPEPMKFARAVNFRAGPSPTDIRSQAIALNVWTAFALVSLMGGTDLVPNLTKPFANHLMEVIVSHSPSGFTPGNISPGFDYDTVTTKPIKFYFPSENRPNHFWRPENPAFVNSGVLAIAPSLGRFLPEDCFALPLPDIAKTLHCDVMEVPGNAFTVSVASILFYFENGLV